MSCLGLGACAQGYEVPRHDLPGLAAYGPAHAPIVLRHDGDDVVITPALEPALRLKRACSFWQHFTLACDIFVTAPLELVRWDGAALVLDGATSAKDDTPRTIRLALDEVAVAEVRVAGGVPVGPRRFALGLAIAGPSVAAAIEFQWLPWRWLALEVGTLPAADMALGFAGARLRPVALGPVRPFVGGFANAWGAVNAETGETASQRAVGPRLGLDLELGSVLLTAELDGVRTFVEDQPLVGDLRGRWLLYGGGAASYRF